MTSGMVLQPRSVGSRQFINVSAPESVCYSETELNGKPLLLCCTVGVPPKACFRTFAGGCNRAVSSRPINDGHRAADCWIGGTTID
jgi:hypothetical protein